ncbi:MAG: ABC transporter ATP-binding protein [Candidatus Omnitrophota bacterium]
MLKVSGLTCGYGQKVIISGVDLDVKGGEFFGLIGPNGSGKTTLLRALSREIKPMSGEIVLDGKKLGDIPARDLARRITVVSQLVPTADMTVEEFVLLGRLPYFKNMQFMETKHDVAVAVKSMELTDSLRLRDKPLRHLSGGERQLAAIARALTQEPRLLLLDEPTAHLDITHQVAVMDLLRKLVREIHVTVVMVLHDLNLASEYCGRMALLSKGCVFLTGTPEDVIDYRVIEEVYKTIVVVNKNPISGKPNVLIVPDDELRRSRKA